MKKLYSLNTSCPIKTKCFLIFIQSVFIYHLCTIFDYFSKTCQSDLDSVISLASSMAHCNFPSISAIYEQCFKQRRLRRYATDRTPLFELEQLPSGRYHCANRVHILSYPYMDRHRIVFLSISYPNTILIISYSSPILALG